MTHTNIAFFYPAENIGGAQILFSRIAEYLSVHNFDITVFDFGNSFISEYLDQNNIRYTHTVIKKGGAVKTEVSENYTFIVTPSYLFLLDQYFSFHHSTKFLFWELHPNNIIEHTLFSYFYKRLYPSALSKPMKIIESNRISKLRNLLEIAHAKDGFYFMCFRNYITNSDFFKLNIQPNYLPVPQHIEQAKVKRTLNITHSLNIGWLSRLDSDKINILNLLIKDLDKYSKNNNMSNITLHIIGTGNSSHKIRKTKNITLVLTGKLSGDDLTDYLYNNIDLAFSMGISALEFGSRTIPTLLVPSPTLYSFYKYLPKKYLWLHDVKGFDVATEKFHKEVVLDLNDIFSDIEALGLSYLGKLSYNYVSKNHSIDSVGSNVIKRLSDSDFVYHDIIESKVYSPSLIETFFLYIKQTIKVCTGKPCLISGSSSVITSKNNNT